MLLGLTFFRRKLILRSLSENRGKIVSHFKFKQMIKKIKDITKFKIKGKSRFE